MAGEVDHRDPAEIARERNEKVADLLGQAEVAEKVASEMDPKTQEDVSVFTSGLVAANNLRLKALCTHLRLPVPAHNGEEQA